MIMLTKFSDTAFILIVFLCIAISMFDINIGALIWTLICLAESNILYMKLTKRKSSKEEVKGYLSV